MANRQLHFDFSHLDQGKNYTFNHSLFSAPLYLHSVETRASARHANPLLLLIPDNRLTHFVDADLPDDTIVLMYVTQPSTVGERAFNHPVHMSIHVPDRGREYVRAQSIRARGHRSPELHQKLARYRPSAEQVSAFAATGNDPEFPEHIQTMQDATDAAVALLFHHGNLINLNKDNGGAIAGIIVEQCILSAVTATQELPIAIFEQGDAWLVAAPVDGTTSLQPSAATMAAVTAPLQQALLLSQNNEGLKGQQWNPRYGVSSSPYGVSSSLSGQVLAETTLDSSGGWVSTNITDMNGLSVDGGSVVYTPPTTTPTWTGSGLWSLNDSASLTSAIAARIRAGAVYVQITDEANPQGALRGYLVPGTPDPDTEMLPLTVTLAPPEGVTTQATGTATFTLNSGGTGLTFTLSVQNLSGEAGAALHADGQANDDAIFRLPFSDTTGMAKLSFQCTNKWLRHLSACIQYLDVGGNVLSPQNWSDKVPGFLRDSFEPDSDKPFVDLIPPVTTVFGVPIPPDATTITIPIWDEVHTVRLLLGGLGRGSYDTAVCPIGITVTALSELALPVFLLAAGTAVTNSAPVKALMADKEVLFAVCAAATFLVAGPTAAYIGLSQDPGAAASGLSAKFGPLLLNPATSLGQWVAGKYAEGAAERAAPFVDIALAIINGAVTAAELCQTIIEVLESPFVYEADISRSMSLSMTLLPDPRYNKFPDYHDYLKVTVVYDCGTTTPVYQETLPSTTLSDPIVIKFNSVPAGGSLRVYACFFAGNGWQSGQVDKTDWIPALPTNDSLSLGNLVVTTNDIPLTKNSVYIHNEKIGLVNGILDWVAAVDSPPTETVTTLSPFEDKEVLRLSTITTAQEPEMLGYAWQATGLNLPPDKPNAPLSNDALWSMQNISVLQHPQKGYASPHVGFSQIPGIAYNMTSADGSETNFFIDSSNPAFDTDKNLSGGWHVRGISLSHAGPAPTFSMGSNASYGRFPIPVDRYVYHPQGYLFGISFAAHKLFRLKLETAPVADAAAPFAVLSSGQGVRDGLMYDPVGIAVALDGRVLVLESGNQRVQSFDIYGNAVPYFANASYNTSDPNSTKTVPTMTLVARANSTYLDISVEAKGYIYVLSYTGDGSSPSMYQVDLYMPDGTFLVTTPNVAAASIVVNVLRDLYTLNYEQFLDANGRVQPSISMWLPPAPNPGSTLKLAAEHEEKTA
jgi:CHRD domain